MFDRGILVIILGQYTNYLITTGKISAACTNDVTTAVQILAMAIITIGTGAIGILHKPQPGQRNILQVIKDLLIKTPTPQPLVGTAPETSTTNSTQP